MEEKILLHKRLTLEIFYLLHRSLTREENSPAQKVKVLLHGMLGLEKNIFLHRKTTLEKKRFPPLLLGIEPVTF